MKKDALTLAMVQMNVVEDKEQNLKAAEGYIGRAGELGADLVVLPEMFSCPYLASNFPLYAEPEGGESWGRMARAAGENGVYLVAGSLPERDEQGRVYNTAYAFDRAGRQIGRHRKMHLFDIAVEGGQVFKESDTLTAGHEVTVFPTEYGAMGLCVCYDLRFPELSRLMTDRGAVVILAPGAFNMTTGPAHWELLFRARALDNQVFAVGVAPARREDGPYVSYGNSIAVSPWGDVLQRLDEKEGICLCRLELSQVEKVRAQLPLLAHRRHDVYSLGER